MGAGVKDGNLDHGWVANFHFTSLHFISPHHQQDQLVIMHQCPACLRTYSRSENLSSHIRRVNDTDHTQLAEDLDRIKCKVCGIEFGTATRRKLHEKTGTCITDPVATSTLFHQSHIGRSFTVRASPSSSGNIFSVHKRTHRNLATRY